MRLRSSPSATSHYLVSVAGFPNYGDELITAAWIRYLAEKAPKTPVWLDCPQPGLASVLFAGMHPMLRTTNSLWRSTFESAEESPNERAKQIEKLFETAGSPAYDLGIEEFNASSTVHLLGGGYLNRLWDDNTGILGGILEAKRVHGTPVFATGLGLLPVGEGRPTVQAALSAFDYAEARDAESAREFDIQLGLDDAFLAAEHEVARALRRGSDADYVVCIQSDLADEETFGAIIADVRMRLQAAIAEGKTVSYVEAIPGIDHLAYARLSDLIPPDRFLPFAEVWRSGLPLRAGQVWLTTRFHCHFLAACVGAKGIAYGTSPGYYDIKHASLLALGTGWSYSTPDSPAGEPSASEEFARMLPARSAEKRDLARRLYGYR